MKNVEYKGSKPPVCGVPLGGIGTGCLDIEANGMLGYTTQFNSHVMRRGPLMIPLMGVCVNHNTWVCTTQPVQHRHGEVMVDTTNWQHIGTPHHAQEIHYRGAYPIIEMDYEFDNAPFEMSMRCFSPFIPGDAEASNTPAALFEIILTNTSDQTYFAKLAFNFPGPTEGEALTTRFRRSAIKDVGPVPMRGVHVQSELASYCLAALDETGVRVGGALGCDPGHWAMLPLKLPFAREQAGATLTVDRVLEPGESRLIRIVLSWYAPTFSGGGTNDYGQENPEFEALFEQPTVPKVQMETPSENSQTVPGDESAGSEDDAWRHGHVEPITRANWYRHMYAKRFPDALAVARYLATNHEELLARIIAWQSVIENDTSLPDWLPPALINMLHLIPETSFWIQKKYSGGDLEWVDEERGLYAMNESPRLCPQTECIPCTFYGSMPLMYFFPELIETTIEGYRAYQFEDGAMPFAWGGCTLASPPCEFIYPAKTYAIAPQSTLDGPCYVDLVRRFWKLTGDRDFLERHYEAIKRNVEFTMNLRPGSGDAGVVSMPEGDRANDWYECCQYHGIVPHIGGIHLAQLRMAEDIAMEMNDHEFAQKCAAWQKGGSQVLEAEGWGDGNYLLYHDTEMGEKSSIILSHQLDGEWMVRFQGLEGVFRKERVLETLDTLKRVSIADHAAGASVFTIDSDDPWDPGYWGPKGSHPPGNWMLAMLYFQMGDTETAHDLAKRPWDEGVRRGWAWDWPVAFDRAGGQRQGYDYYQNLMIWSLPSVFAGGDFTQPAQADGLVDRVLRAANSDAIVV